MPENAGQQSGAQSQQQDRPKFIIHEDGSSMTVRSRDPNDVAKAVEMLQAFTGEEYIASCSKLVPGSDMVITKLVTADGSFNDTVTDGRRTE
ncbi:hypothetical protein FLONG3_4592 [Fusarium longipes]|uniref:Uncharacterized protein n=1 Tax=Fusarium longipes TaxID=694270 RepID=A0A395SXT0_9HYPO|nr:hypothetical protein FLONG3_4592 [Fusarium longipes]